MNSKARETRKYRARVRKPSSANRCPVCGSRLDASPARQERPLDGWGAEELEQLVEEMDLSDVAMLLGISRWELEKRCQSLGLHLRGSEEEEE